MFFANLPVSAHSPVIKYSVSKNSPSAAFHSFPSLKTFVSNQRLCNICFIIVILSNVKMPVWIILNPYEKQRRPMVSDVSQVRMLKQTALIWPDAQIVYNRH